MKKGFTLIEMLIVIGIIAILTGASIAAYSKMVATAENTKAHELVLSVATAMGVYYQKEGQWPRTFFSASENMLSETVAYPLGSKGYMNLEMKNGKLSGYDRFGIVTPWATDFLKRKGRQASLTDIVSRSKEHTATLQDHVLRFAVDDDGDGLTVLPSGEEGSGGVKVRATACVWCCDKSGLKTEKHRIQSWTKGQEVKE